MPAAGQFATFAQCCQVSFSQPSSTPLRGNGISSFECYLAPGVYDPPCYVYSGSTCLLTSDPNLCRSGVQIRWSGVQIRWSGVQIRWDDQVVRCADQVG